MLSQWGKIKNRQEDETMESKQMKLKPSYYSITPATVRYDEDLCPNAKWLYSEITALSTKDGYCWAKNRYFAELYHVTKTTISRWIRQLKEKGYIKVEMIYKHDSKEIEQRNIYIIDDPISKIDNTPLFSPTS